MGILQGDTLWSRDTKTAQFEILQNRVPYANFQKTKIPIDPLGFEPGIPCVLCGRAIRCSMGTREILAKNFSQFELVW